MLQENNIGNEKDEMLQLDIASSNDEVSADEVTRSLIEEEVLPMQSIDEMESPSVILQSVDTIEDNPFKYFLDDGFCSSEACSEVIVLNEEVVQS